MHRFIVVILAAYCMGFPSAEALSGGTVQDLGPAKDAIEDLSSEDVRDEALASFDASDELFPAQQVGSDSALEQQRDSRVAEFLTIRVGVKRVTLRDVPLKEWFAPYIRAIAELGLVSGYRDASGMPTGAFGPADSVTLEQVAKVIVLASGVDATSCPLPSRNVSASGSWSASYVSCAERGEWAVFADPSTDVRRPATREEVVMTVLQAFHREFDVDTASLAFSDVEKTSAYAPAVARAAADGVVSGYTDAEGNLTGTFGPTNHVTRAEFSKIVTIALQLYSR